MDSVDESTLAVHVTHQLTEHYPDGQIFLDQHAHSEARPPVEPGAALDLLLRALGVPGEEIPADIDGRAARWRASWPAAGCYWCSTMRQRRAGAPLLPGTSGCLTLVTSRRRLADLDSTDVVSLDALAPGDAAELFGRILGAQWVTADPGEVAEVVGLCDRLPLAIRIAAARLRARPAWTVQHLAQRLRHRQRLLTQLAVGDRSRCWFPGQPD